MDIDRKDRARLAAKEAEYHRCMDGITAGGSPRHNRLYWHHREVAESLRMDTERCSGYGSFHRDCSEDGAPLCCDESIDAVCHGPSCHGEAS